MKVSYDKKTDAMYIYLTRGKKKVTRTEEMSEGWMADYSGKEIIGIEILNVSKVIGPKLKTSSSTYRSSVAHSIKVKP